MANRFFRLALMLAIFAVTGCVTGPATTNLTPAYLQLDPSISTYKEPSADFDRLQTFSVVPASLISTDIKMNEILEKQLLFFARNLFEARGYRFVDLSNHPDFLITLTANSEYKESYVPPQTVTVPKWVPGQTVTTHGNSSGTINYNTFGKYSSYGFGSYSGTSTSTTYIPGYATSDTYTQPGYNVGHYYPAVLVAALDSKTFEMIWLGSGAGTSNNPDVRISSQLVLSQMVSQFPAPSQEVALTNLAITPSDGVVGISLAIFTPDGNNYLPTIIELAEKSPAKQVGLKLYDMILSIDGMPMANRPFSEVLNKLVGEPGSTVNLEVWRVDQRIPVTVTRVPRDQVN